MEVDALWSDIKGKLILKMKLLLNTIPLNPPLTGIGNYTLCLLEQFAQMPDFEHVYCFNGVSWLDAKEALTKHYEQVGQATQGQEESSSPVVQRHPLWRRVVRNIPYAYKAKQYYLDYRLARHQQQLQNYIYHEPNFVLQKHAGPTVTTIHDLSPIHYPQHHPAARIKWFSEGMADTLSRVNQILTVSNLVREDLIERYGLAPDRVHTTYLAAADRFHPRNAEQTQRVLDQYGLTHGQYLLFVGTIEPRKGVIDLLDAWEQLPSALRVAYPLVLAGGLGWRHEDTMSRIQRLVDKGEVKYLNYVANNELPLLLSGCLSFVFPSVYEGFGLPVLEAMASGVPVLCRENTSMAEFAEGAVLLHENSTESLSHQLASLIEGESLRQQVAAQGLKKAAQFSWEKCATQTVEVYKRCL